MVAGGEETNHCENCQAGAHCGPDDHSSVERSLQQLVIVTVVIVMVLTVNSDE